MSGISNSILKDVKSVAIAAGQNEQLTRRRVEHLEQRMSEVDALFGRTFWGRLNWLLRGR